ncbi:MAG TPA: hypothetical protein VN706_08860 [Gemmatimonadaceae bacterium]|nr:hypothetical protein [Gemmatimonadaceae bacterium]
MSATSARAGVRRRVFRFSAVAAFAATACESGDTNFVRGHGLTVDTLAAADQARVYEAAARGSFDVDNTSLLLDRRLLPRETGLAEAGRVPDAVVAELRRRGTIKGTCEPPLTGTRGAPRCAAQYPGYVVRYSPVFAIVRDSVQVYLYAQKYDTPASGHAESLRFERAYQVVRHGGEWRAAREGHVPKDVRGER